MIFDLWRNHQMWGMFFAVTIICVFIYRDYGKLFGLSLWYFLMSALFVFMNPITRYFPKDLQLLLDGATGKAFAILFVIALLLLPMTKKAVDLGFDILEITFAVNAIVVMIVGYGIFNARSADTGTMACILPSIWFRKSRMHDYKLLQIITTSLILLSIVVMKGSTSYFVLAFLALAYMVHKGLNLKIVGAAISLVAIIALVGWTREGEDFLSTSNRWEYWKIFMTWFWDHINFWVGSGLGTFEWLGPYIQANVTDAEAMRTRGFFLFLHNEYLQVLFETGFVGLILAGAIWLRALIESHSEKWLFMTIAGTSMLMFTQYPLRFFISAAFVALLVKRSHIGNARN